MGKALRGVVGAAPYMFPMTVHQKQCNLPVSRFLKGCAVDNSCAPRKESKPCRTTDDARLERSWGGGLDCGSNPLKPSPSRLFGDFLVGARKSPGGGTMHLTPGEKA